MTDRKDRHYRPPPGKYPDHRLTPATLNKITTHATLPKNLLLKTLEEHPGQRIGLHVTDAGISVVPANDRHPGIPPQATMAGQTLQIRFEPTTPHPAMSTTIGPDVPLDPQETPPTRHNPLHRPRRSHHPGHTHHTPPPGHPATRPPG
ncbi:hypothetical protein ACFVU3_39995, partial [Streptomyces sp. NPDC058052]